MPHGKRQQIDSFKWRLFAWRYFLSSFHIGISTFRVALFRLFAWRYFVFFACVISFFRLFAWRLFVSLFRLFAWRYFVFSRGVISSFRMRYFDFSSFRVASWRLCVFAFLRVALFRGGMKRRNGTNQPQ